MPFCTQLKIVQLRNQKDSPKKESACLAQFIDQCTTLKEMHLHNAYFSDVVTMIRKSVSFIFATTHDATFTQLLKLKQFTTREYVQVEYRHDRYSKYKHFLHRHISSDSVARSVCESVRGHDNAYIVMSNVWFQTHMSAFTIIQCLIKIELTDCSNWTADTLLYALQLPMLRSACFNNNNAITHVPIDSAFSSTAGYFVFNGFTLLSHNTLVQITNSSAHITLYIYNMPHIGWSSKHERICGDISGRC